MEAKNLIAAVTERKTVEDAEVKDGVLVVTFKPARQFSAQCVCERLQRKGFKALHKSRVLAVKLPSEEEELTRLEALLRPSTRKKAEEVAEELISQLK